MKTIEDIEIAKLQGLKVLVVNVCEKKHNTHFNLEEALNFIALVKPDKAYLTYKSPLGFMKRFKNNYLPMFSLHLII
jgi:phosphoribosyl 1,2-cyclic phosphate phosphodiesterase